MKLTSAVDYQNGRVVAEDLVKNDNGQATVLAFDEGAVIARHKAPGDVLITVLEGDVVFVVEGEQKSLSAGDYLTMSVGTEHEVYAQSKAKVLLTFVKPNTGCGCSDKQDDKVEGLLPEA